MAERQTWYTPEVKRAVHAINKPITMKVHIVEFPNMITVRVYDEDIMPMSLKERMVVIKYLLEVRDVIRSFGIPCEIEGVKVAGR